MKGVNRRDRFMIIIMMLARFTGSLSQNMLTTALISIMESFGINVAIAQGLTTGNAFVMGIITAISVFRFNRFLTKKQISISLMNPA